MLFRSKDNINKLDNIKSKLKNNFVDFVIEQNFASTIKINEIISNIKETRDIKVCIVEEKKELEKVVYTEDNKFSIFDLSEKYLEQIKESEKNKKEVISHINNIYNKLEL